MDFYKIISFSNSLDDIISSELSLFNEKMLMLIKELFGYSDSIILAYSGDRLSSGIGINRGRDILARYVDKYSEKDDFAHAISQKTKVLSNSEPNVFKSTDLIKNIPYEDSSYCSFLSRSGLKYAISMQIDNFRIQLFKADDDFSEEEEVRIKAISSIIIAKNNTFQKFYMHSTSLIISYKALDHVGCAVIVFDDQGRLIGCNDKTMEYLEKMSVSVGVTRNIKNTIVKYVESHGFSMDDLMRHSPLRILDFEFTYSTEVRTDEFGFINKYHYITIKKSTEEQTEYMATRMLKLKYGLTNRESIICERIAKGLSYKDIASELTISTNTVKTHVQNIYYKLNVRNQRELIQILYRL